MLLADGVADSPVPELNQKTPLQVACKPHIDRLAQMGKVGLVQTVPPDLPPGSDVANLAVLGYDPKIYYTGRSPLEAVSIGVELKPTDLAFRCNLVTLSDTDVLAEKIMVDYSSDEISTEESRELMKDIAQALNSEQITFYSGISYRHLMVWEDGPANTELTPPHDISDRKIGPYLPQGPGADILLHLMNKSQKILENHPVNQRRIACNLRPATSVWFWGQGKRPQIDSFYDKYHLRGAMISAVDLLKGLGICAGLNSIDVPGATGNIHTNFRGKAEAAIEAFKHGADFVYLHFEAPDEAGHRGEIDNKVKSIEKIDSLVLAYILEELPKIDESFKIMLLPDHPTPLALKTHTSDPVPFIIFDSQKPVSGKATYDEVTASQTGLFINEGYRLMDDFILG